MLKFFFRIQIVSEMCPFKNIISAHDYYLMIALIIKQISKPTKQ